MRLYERLNLRTSNGVAEYRCDCFGATMKYQWLARCEANAEDTVRYRLCAFFSHIPYSQVCAHEVHGWALESGKAGGIGANSSWYGGCSAHLRASSTFVLLATHPSERVRGT